MGKNRELNDVISRIRYQLKAIIRKLNIQYQYVDNDDLLQEILLYLWQQNESGQLNNKNNSYILQGCYYYLKNYLRKHLRSDFRQAGKEYDESLAQDQEGNENLNSYHKNLNDTNFDEYLYFDEFNKNLSAQEKTLLSLKMRGLTTREIGKELGISHTMVVKIRKKMQKKYQSFSQ